MQNSLLSGFVDTEKTSIDGLLLAHGHFAFILKEFLRTGSQSAQIPESPVSKAGSEDDEPK